jgi:hypothetical protein
MKSPQHALYRIHRLDIYETAIKKGELIKPFESLQHQIQTFNDLKELHEKLITQENLIQNLTGEIK